MEVLILTEAGSGRGYGHFIRCSALLEAFLRSGDDVRMWVDSKQPIDERILKGSSYIRRDWKNEIGQLLPARSAKPLVTVVDSYEADETLLSMIAGRSRTCCFFDDNSRIHYPDGILVNSAIGADSLYSSRRSNMVLLTGPNYAVLRKEFWVRPAYIIREHVKVAFIALGSNVPKEEVQAVASGWRKLLKLSSIIAMHESVPANYLTEDEDGIRWVWGLQAREFIDMAMLCDVAICSGGQILVELACLGIPTVSVLTAENQRKSIMGFEKAGFADHLDHLEQQIGPMQLRAKAIALVSSEIRTRRSSVGRRLVDGQGALRVVRAIKERTWDKGTE